MPDCDIYLLLETILSALKSNTCTLTTAVCAEDKMEAVIKAAMYFGDESHTRLCENERTQLPRTASRLIMIRRMAAIHHQRPAQTIH